MLLQHYYFDNYNTLCRAAVLLQQYYYDNYNTLLCPPCYYNTTTSTTTTRCAVPAVLLQHYCYDNYNTLCRARRATTTPLLRQLQHAVPCPPCYYYSYYYIALFPKHSC